MPWLMLTAALFCSDLTLPLDDSLKDPRTFADRLTRDSALYMVRGLAEARDDGEAFVVGCRGAAPDLLNALRTTLAFDGTLDPQALRGVYEARYHDLLAARGHEPWMPSTLAEFAAKTSFRSWPAHVVERSMVKRKPRRIFRSPDGFVPAISVAETLESETGDPEASVRETEVGIQRTSTDWDFYVFDHAGARAKTSTFPVGDRPSPTFCIACHYDSGARTVSRFFREDSRTVSRFFREDF